MQPGKRFLVWLAGLSVLGFLSTDMYLPAFAAIEAALTAKGLGQARTQFRLRNLGGIIIIDFIDMEDEEHQRQVIRTLEIGRASCRERV